MWGFPNITGKWRRGYTNKNTTFDSGDFVGAFCQVENKEKHTVFGTSVGSYSGTLYQGFDASKSVSLCGNSTTVQPTSIYTLMIIKV